MFGLVIEKQVLNLPHFPAIFRKGCPVLLSSMHIIYNQQVVILYIPMNMLLHLETQVPSLAKIEKSFIDIYALRA